MKKFLFGVSDTIECRKAISSVVKLFDNFDTYSITLFHIVSELMVYVEGGVYDYVNFNTPHENKALLDEFRDEFIKYNISVNIVVKEGNLAQILVDFAKKYDLLIIGESESSILHRIFNSNQDLFINVSPIPVLVAK